MHPKTTLKTRFHEEDNQCMHYIRQNPLLVQLTYSYVLICNQIQIRCIWLTVVFTLCLKLGTGKHKTEVSKETYNICFFVDSQKKKNFKTNHVLKEGVI